MSDVTITSRDWYDLEAAVSKAGYSKERIAELYAILDALRDAKPAGDEWVPWDGRTISLSDYEIHMCYRRCPEGA
ncbi:MAG: hypothetical protein ACOYD4_06745 [Solirubrobacterales bacterium]